MASITQLYVFPGTEYSSSIDPESLQVLTYLYLMPTPYKESVEVIKTCKHWQCPSGVFPTLIINGVTYTGANDIIKEFKKEVFNIDESRSEWESSEIIAYSALLTDRLKLAMLYLHWLDGKNYTELTRKWFGAMTRFPFTLYLLSSQHRIAKQLVQQTTDTPLFTVTVEQQGLELVGQAEDMLDLLAVRLGDSKYFYGDSPSSLDALVFGYLDIISQYQLPGNDQLRTRLHSLTHLSQFCNRMRELVFPQIKSRHVSMTTALQRPPIALYKDPTVWLCVGMASMVLVLQGYRVGLGRKIFSNLKNNL